jgi:hypothetical protein
MTPEDALQELLARLGASQGAAVLISDEELSEWPETAVRAMKKGGLLAPASPAPEVVCPGCEQQCFMPVNTLQAGNGKVAFVIFCDKRDDISRVPVSDAKLRRWSTSLTAVAEFAARPLDVNSASSLNGERCEVGVVKGRRHSSHVVLVADGGLSLYAAGHTVDLCDFLKLEGESIRLDKSAIVRLVDKPIATAGNEESAQQRRDRIGMLVRAEKAKGTRAFLKTVAENEGISVSRLKQIVQDRSRKSRSTRRSHY